MSIFKVHAATTITVPDHRNLLAAWRTYGNPLCAALVGSFHVDTPLTDAQLRRLPTDLRERLTNGEPPCTSVVELERIFGLPDMRTDSNDAESAT